MSGNALADFFEGDDLAAVLRAAEANATFAVRRWWKMTIHELQVEKARVKVEYLRAKLHRCEVLAGAQAISNQDVEDATYELEIAKIDLEIIKLDSLVKP